MHKLKYFLFVLLAFMIVACSDNEGNLLKEMEVYPESDTGEPGEILPFHKVDTRENSTSQIWQTFETKTVDRLPGYTMTQEPERDVYGGWKVAGFTNTGEFHIENLNGRWWIVDPEGNPFIHTGVAVFDIGGSDRSKQALLNKYGSNMNWVSQDTELLRSYGFNGTGCWSNVGLIKQMQQPLVYCVYINPMLQFNAYLKNNGEGNYVVQGWQGFPNNVVRVFDPRFDEYVENEAKKLGQYANDKFMIGYFTDNELPWYNEALDNFLKYYNSSDPGYQAAKAWLDERKGKDATVADINNSDRLAFTGFYFETYMKKITDATKKYAPNKLYLGCRFNQHAQELSNPEIFKAAGKYMDIVSINHYRKWEPEPTPMKDWVNWSGKPFMVTEFYVKGEDSGLPNKTGAGWNVKTQVERGYFYQNFTLELIRSKGCVGWHWFNYQDNDPENPYADESNRDSNKGVVTWDYKPYNEILDNMKALNTQIFQLTKYYDQ